MHIEPIKSLKDNYIWIIKDTEGLTVIDPGTADGVLEFSQKNGVNVTHILLTHHHWDHINGVQKLLDHFPSAKVTGPKSLSNAFMLNTIIEKDTEVFRSVNPVRDWHILHTPGHTLDHICYYHDGYLFPGDTVFSGGCGRIFEGSHEQMYNSLSKITKLPLETKIYPAHEYTLDNLLFAEKIYPNSKYLQQYKANTLDKHSKNQPSLPTTLQQEKLINPFFKAHEVETRRKIEMITKKSYQDALEVFVALRNIKDKFQS
ncbi:MAG: hydroxyacylglutathione hydrolase [Pseudomonadota bacterium]|nr:hydroxyacylglutathione hydrolase [Pseudomonadota bacterium]